jgi:hypothetical protein
VRRERALRGADLAGDGDDRALGDAALLLGRFGRRERVQARELAQEALERRRRAALR